MAFFTRMAFFQLLSIRGAQRHAGNSGGRSLTSSILPQLATAASAFGRLYLQVQVKSQARCALSFRSFAVIFETRIEVLPNQRSRMVHETNPFKAS
jgi:hypothetical protein